MTPNFFGQGWTELLNPAQDRPPAHVNASIREPAGDAFSRSTQLQVVPDGEQDDVVREAMASDEADGLSGGVAATRTAGMNGATTLVAAIASEIGRRAAGQERIRRPYAIS
jgi:L-serine deaminase